MPASLRWGAATHPGQVRMNNEDAYAADDGMWVVADGMGGHLAGEVASAYTIDALRAANRVGITSSSDMVDAVQQANDTIRHEAQTNPGRRGMGTTVTALAVMHHPENPQLVVANVGDSRTYLWRDGQLLSVTVDHSYVQELVSGGEITVDEARTHPRRNIVTRALGIEPGVVVDTWTLAAVKGDRYILCSDGLVDEATDEEIAAVVAAESDPQRAAERLVAVANDHGGRDNVTVIVVDVVDGEPVAPPAPAIPAAEPIATETSDDDDTARINRTLQTDAAGADGDTDAAPLAAAASGEPTAPTGMPLPAPGTSVDEAGPDSLPPPDREVYVDGKPLRTPPVQPAAAVPPATPIDDAGGRGRKVSKAALAFWAAIAAILVTVIVVIALAVTGGDDDPPPTTTTTSTSSSTTSSTSSTSTTTPTTTAAVTTAPAATTAPAGVPPASPPVTVAPTSPTAP
jgi:serine/threonine protein phosphatase PrpC